MVEHSDRPELSVVILCYREEDYIPELVNWVKVEIASLGISYELILVANYLAGSLDRSAQIASAIARQERHVRVIAKPKEGMMGWDMRQGLEASRGRVVAVMDGDGQVHPADLVRVYRELRTQHLDLCQPYRTHREDGWRRRLLSQAYNGVFALFFPGTGLHDVNAKPKLLTREAYESLKLASSDWFIDAEIVLQARRHRLRLGEIPASFGKGRGRPSFIRLPVVAEFLKNLVRCWVWERFNRR